MLRLESITQAYPDTCGTYSYSIELADPAHTAYFGLVGDEITIFTSTITDEFSASMTVKFLTNYHEEVFIDPVVCEVISCEAH